MAGARLTGLYPLGPVMDGAGLNVTVLSNEDRIGFGFIACRELVPDLWQLADDVRVELAALVQAVKPKVSKAPASKAPRATKTSMSQSRQGAGAATPSGGPEQA
jgi:hypothetical protein